MSTIARLRHADRGRGRRHPLVMVLSALLVVGVAGVAGCGGGSAAPGRPAASGNPAGAFVTSDGGRLELDGRPFRFTGINVWNANTPANSTRYGCGEPLDLEEVAPTLGPGVEVVRAWFFQRLATTLDGRRDWSTFDRTLSAARRRHIRIIATLGNQWPQCEGYPSYQAGYKTEQWYRTGYVSTPPPGQPDSYRDWVQEVVSRYRDDPTIAMWQLMNEAEDASSYRGPCRPAAPGVLQAFTEDVATLVKRLDRRHLVSLGTVGAGQCGAAAGEYASLLAIPAVDVAEYHDYSVADIPGDRWNGLAERLRQAAALDKPLVVGEMGVAPRVVGGLGPRATLVGRKIEAQFRAGVAGILLWTWRGSPTGDGYDVGPADPVLGVLASAASAAQPQDPSPTR